MLGAGGNALLGMPAGRRRSTSWSAAIDPSACPASTMLSACPLMHGTGQFSSFIAMNLGGAIVTLPSRRFSADGAVERGRAARKANASSIVGQAFAAPDAGGAGRQPGRATTCQQRPDHHVVGRDVEPGEQGRPAAPPAPGDPVRLVRLVGGGRPRRIGQSRRAPPRRRPSSCSATTCAVFTEDGRRVEPGSGEQGMVADHRLHPDGLLQGRGEVGADVPHLRGQALERARRLGRGRRRRHAAPARPRLGVHQHRRREGLPRGGRGGAEDAPRRARRRVPWACPTSASAR